MRIALIAALSKDGTIGDKGKIPWHISADLRRFKQTTIGHAVIIGRKTFESIGKPLPGRKNFVLSRQSGLRLPDGVLKFPSLEAALDCCRQQGESVAFIIGGAELYRQALPLADTLLLTHVHTDVTGETKFPDFDRSRWVEKSREDSADYSFVEYERLHHVSRNL